MKPSTTNSIATFVAAIVVILLTANAHAEADDAIVSESQAGKVFLERVSVAIEHVQSFREKGALDEATYLLENDLALSDFSSPLIRSILGLNDFELQLKYFNEAGHLYSEIGAFEAARDHYAEALQLAQLGYNLDQSSIANVHLNYALSAQYAGDFELARKNYIKIIANSELPPFDPSVEAAQEYLFILEASQANNRSNVEAIEYLQNLQFND